ncbi:putative transmembrane protein [Cupriavidus sp. U2]|uniref:Mpo1-like protein n=1 Tax=Cupriavidus sp. U2 TaxID=2920269 RepID=UPI00129E78FE|nr:Mpo1-like protein [Cupriavidus sp. U2]KAI3591574.1 putative transmembrane protein [Cupriavidus sp. U2]
MAQVHAKEFASFADFYPYYLSEHRDRTCRRLHFAGSTLALACLVTLAVTGNAWWLLAALVSGYAFAWVGHFGFEKNRPATFRHPFYSLMGDWVMYADILRGRIPF